MSDTGPQYREIRPHGVVARHVRCVWRLTGSASGSATEPVIPDGCGEVVLNAADPFVQRNADGSIVMQPRALVAGQLSRAMLIGPSARIDVWGIRFHPWAAATFLGTDAHELCDRVFSLGDVSASFARDCSSALGGESESERESLLLSVLARRATRLPASSEAVPALVRFAEHARQTPTVSAMAKQMGVTTRRVQRVFRDRVGLSPKQLLRIGRLQRALRLAGSSRSLTWAAIAAHAGYFDQAHLIRDVRDIAGVTPAELFRRQGAITEAFLSEPSAAH